MRKCNSCTAFVISGFYCSDCSYRYAGPIIITNKDFEIYINRSFRTNYKITSEFGYRDIYNDLTYRFPKIYPLRNILENIKYLKSLKLI